MDCKDTPDVWTHLCAKLVCQPSKDCHFLAFIVIP